MKLKAILLSLILVFNLFLSVSYSSNNPNWKDYMKKTVSDAVVNYAFNKLMGYLEKKSNDYLSSNSISNENIKSEYETYYTESVGEDWFLILGSFKKSEYERAKKRSNMLEEYGHLAFIIDSNNYSNFRKNLYVVVMGPYKKDKALKIKSHIKSLVKDAYIKSGW